MSGVRGYMAGLLGFMPGGDRDGPLRACVLQKRGFSSWTCKVVSATLSSLSSLCHSSHISCPSTPSKVCPDMALLNLVYSPLAPAVLVVGFLAYYLVPYFITYRHLRQIPAPFPAQFSNFWLLRAARRGERYKTVHEVHQKLGPVVRIQPNHVSIADDEAIPLVLGHGNGFLKS